MLNAIPVLGWLLDLLLSISLAVPFWFCWTVCGLGWRYFGWLPPQFHAIPFWHAVGLFIILGILKGFSPVRLAASSSADKKD